MADSPRDSKLSNREIFEATYSGAQGHTWIPRLAHDPRPHHRLPETLQEFREQEGRPLRKRRLRALWEQLPHKVAKSNAEEQIDAYVREGSLTKNDASKLKEAYQEELLQKCKENDAFVLSSEVSWKEFVRYAEAKEVELWHIFYDLDLDGNGHIEAEELAIALDQSGINATPATLSDFMSFVTASPHSRPINFAEFRDFMLLLPRKVSTAEMFRYYQVRKFLGDDGRGAARVTMEGDVTLSAEDMPPYTGKSGSSSQLGTASPPVDHGAAEYELDEDEDDYEEEEEESHFSASVKFLLAGGIAGAVSRTCTAPFDRLKVYLITRAPEVVNSTLQAAASPQAATELASKGAKAISGAIRQIYIEGGVLAFWVGNGLSVAKIFPESAIKFYSYETSKRFFATYVDHVDDSRNISGTSRFISGGIGGIASQLSIYPVETLKTQMMSTTGEKRTLQLAAQRLWALGGVRAFYRGLTIGLIGVFPYAAIDMSTFEALKLAYLRSSGKEDAGVLHLLAFGTVSGGIGATSVYPLNLVRTRLQASGSSGHPQRYTGIWDVAAKTHQKEGWRGFYRGLFPTLAKVIPSVSISYVVYENSKKWLGV